MDNNPINNNSASFSFSSISQLSQMSNLQLFGVIAGSSLIVLFFMWIIKRNKQNIHNFQKQSTHKSKNKGKKKKQKIDQVQHPFSNQNQDSEQLIKIQNRNKNQTDLLKFQIKRSLIKTQEQQQQSLPIKSQKQLESQYQSLLIGSIALRQANSPQHITSIAFKGSKILLTNTKNELILFDMKKWKKQKQNPQRFYTTLQSNTGTALAIGKKHFYVALGFDKTIALYDFFGGQDGVYFKLFKRFQRNILSSDAKIIYVPQHQHYIATAGSGSDTTIQVWSLQGEKLQILNTYQIDHYSIGLGLNQILVRGWTSQVKQFVFHQDKQRVFKKLQKSKHLPHKQSPLCSNLDNLGKYAVTVNKNKTVNLWNLKSQLKLLQKTVSFEDMNISSINNCYLYTMKYQNERVKTIVILTSNTNKIYICDKHLKVIGQIQGVECKQVSITGSPKNLILFTMNSEGRVFVWTLNKQIECIDQQVD